MVQLTKAGRRLTLAGSLFISGCFCVTLMALGGAPAIARTIMATMGKLCITTAFAVVYVYSAELFPTAVRSSAMVS